MRKKMRKCASPKKRPKNAENSQKWGRDAEHILPAFTFTFIFLDKEGSIYGMSINGDLVVVGSSSSSRLSSG